MCGVVDGGIVPGLYGYEAGQSGVGDIFGHFVDTSVPADYRDEAARAGHRRPRAPDRAGGGAGGRRARPARARLAQRQPVGAGRPRALRLGARRDPDHPAGGHLPRADRGDRVRDPHHRRDVHRRPACRSPSWSSPAGWQRTPMLMQIYADVTRLPLQHRHLDAGAGGRLGDPRRGRGRCLPRCARRGRGDGQRAARRLHAGREERGERTTRCSPSTRRCTTTSAAAATT